VSAAPLDGSVLDRAERHASDEAALHPNVHGDDGKNETNGLP
jgi:hypothetical protein